MGKIDAITDEIFGAEPLLLIDGHADIPDPSEVPDKSQTIDTGTDIALDRLRAGGVGAIVLAANVMRGDPDAAGVAANKAGIDAKLEAIREICRRHPDKAELALSSEAVVRIAASGRVAVLLEMLGTHGLDRDLAGIARYYQDGLRILGFTHIGNTALADSSRPVITDMPYEHGGLSDLGRQAVELANDLGLLLDVSQLSTDALLQVAELSRAPVIASHSAIRALVDSPRNLRDEEMDAIASRGGVVGIVAFSSYLRNLTPDEVAARAEITERFGGLKEGYKGMSLEQRQAYWAATNAVTRRADLDDYLTAIDYAVARIGIDHVALSSDFNQGGGIVGWMHADEAPNVTAALLDRGYGPDQIRKLWGGNFLRMLREAENAAQPG